MFIKPRAIIVGFGLSVVLAALLLPSRAAQVQVFGPPIPSRNGQWMTGWDNRKIAVSSVRKVLDDQVAAWNKGDLEGFMAGYWKSRELSFFSGKDKTRGWQAALERYQKRYQAEGREMGKLSFSELEIEAFNGDAVWVRGRWKVTTSKETVDGLFTLIFKRVGGGWRIVHDHTSG
jgi:ketosteroid isomerase-like protein